MEDEAKLIRQFEQQHIKQCIDSFKAESDRGTVLVSIAILDKIVENRLISVLSKGNSKARDRLLRPPLGALSGFSSKVDFLYCSGLMPNAEYGDFRLLNKLRNKCAHGWEHFEMTTEIFDEYVKPMFIARSLKAGDDLGKGVKFLEGKNVSEQFKVIMATLICIFSGTSSLVTLECVDRNTRKAQEPNKPFQADAEKPRS